jgi:hypothetical protein
MNRALLAAGAFLGLTAIFLGLRGTALARGGVYLPKVTHELPPDILGTLENARNETAGFVQKSNELAASLKGPLPGAAQTGANPQALDQAARDLAGLNKSAQALAEGIEWLDAALRENSVSLQGGQISAGDKLNAETETLQRAASELHDLAERDFAGYSWLNFFSPGWKIRHEAAKVFAAAQRLGKASAHMISTSTVAKGKR